MLRLLGCLLCIAVTISLALDRRDFHKYRAVEAYEVRPGVLMLPKYSRTAQVCEITLERLHYANNAANLYPGLPRELVTQIFDELVPEHDRGPRTMDIGPGYISEYAGNSITTFAEYANVSFDIYGLSGLPRGSGDIVATIRWKQRNCR